MTLLEPRRMIPARLGASRRNARQSTGLRNARGEAPSRMNGMGTARWKSGAQ